MSRTGEESRRMRRIIYSEKDPRKIGARKFSHSWVFCANERWMMDDEELKMDDRGQWMVDKIKKKVWVWGKQVEEGTKLNVEKEADLVGYVGKTKKSR